MTEVEVDEVLGFVGDVRAEVTANDAVPSGVVLLVEFLLDVGGDVLLDVELLKSLGGDVDGILLHVCVLKDKGLPSDMSAFFTTAFLSAIGF